MRSIRTLVVMIVLASTFTALPSAEAQQCTTNLTISPPDNSALPNAQKGVAYETTIQVSGGSGHYNFQHAGGTLPPGLDWNPKGHGTGTLTISGTPTSYGKSNFTFAIYDWPNYPAALNCIAVQARYTIDIPYADLVLSQSAAPNPPKAGVDLVIKATVANNGLNEATDPVFTETLPSNVTLNSATWRFFGDNPSSNNCSSGSGIVTCNLETLFEDESADRHGVDITIVVTPNDTGPLTFTANVNSAVFDPYTPNNTSTLNLQTEASTADVDVGITVSKGRIRTTETVEVSVGVGNHGPDTATDVVARMTLPGLKVKSLQTSQGTCTRGNESRRARPVCTIGSIPKDDRIRILITAQGVWAGNHSEAAKVESSNSDPAPTNNTDVTDLKVDPVADVQVKFDKDGGAVDLVVSNAGPDDVVDGKIKVTVLLNDVVLDKFARGADFPCEEVRVGNVSCTVGRLYEGEQKKVRLLVTPTDGLPRLKAKASSPVFDPRASNNIDSLTW